MKSWLMWNIFFSKILPYTSLLDFALRDIEFELDIHETAVILHKESKIQMFLYW